MTPVVLAQVGRDLIRSGDSMHVIRMGRDGLVRLIPASSWHWEGSHDPASWTVRVTAYGPSTSTTWNLPASGVVFVRWGSAPGQPYVGIGPLSWAHTTARLQSEAERSLADEAQGPLAQLLAIPADGGDAGDDDPLKKLKADIAGARGKALLVETSAAGWGEGRTAAPQPDWQAARLGPMPPESMATIRRDAFEAVLAACGTPPSLFVDSDGTSQREAVRRWHLNTVLYHRAECLTHVGDSQAVRSLTQCGEPMRFAMAAPIDLRNDFDSVSLRRLAKRTRDATQSRRLLALAEVYDGGSRTDASRIGGVGLQIIRDWVLRFNARGPDGLVDGKSPGAPSKLNADHRRALAEVVEAGPVPAVDGVVRWRRKDLARWLLETFAISLDETTVGRELKALGFAKISARPRHYAQNELAVEAFKKNFPAELAKIRARLPKGVEIELWWQDEARIGQKNKLTRRWARRGTRPRAPRDQRTEWAYIFGAICPAKGKGAGLVMPWCDTDAMAAHLIEISAAVDPGAHAVLIVDQAGWHLTPKLAIPDNITVLALPPRSPELNPVENVWQFMRDNWLSNRIFKSYEDIVALCCQAWNNLIDQPWKIMSLGMRKWAHGF